MKVQKIFSKKWLSKTTFGGLVFGLAAGLAFTTILWVRAVAPGEISNPTFGPQTDDVVGSISGMSCTWDGWYCVDAGNPCDGSNNKGSGFYHITELFCDNGLVTDLRIISRTIF